MLVNYELLYASVGCNKSSNILAWNKTGQVALAFNNSVAIYIPYKSNVEDSGKIIEILNGHITEITFLNWDIESPSDILISAAKDGTIILWVNKSQIKFQWQHNQHVTAVSTKLINKYLFIFSTSMDSTLHIAISNKQELLMSHSHSLGYDIGLSLASTYLTSTQILLACGLTNGDIRLYLITLNALPNGEKNCKNLLNFQEISTVLRGHQDWIRDLNFLTTSFGKIYLLSCSQDCTIRVWTIASRLAKNPENSDSNECFRTATESFKDHTGKEYKIHLESTLQAHKNWVYSVRWHPSAADDKSTDLLSFVSASIDETCILWHYDPTSGLWLDQVRLGTIKGLGFYGASFSPDGQMVLANAINGSPYMWKRQSGTSKWNSYLMVTGHCGPVMDICWQPRGQFLLTTSTDQTTRLHAPWIEQSLKKHEGSESVWMELCRAQVHGYDMTGVCAINAYTYASGSEEKIVRIFRAPRNFINNFGCWTGHSLLDEHEMDTVQIPDTASNNPLDLTNLSVYSSDSAMERQNIVSQALVQEDFPTENLLHQSTLWPEERKLYGHGYDIYSLAYNPVHNILASACKASKADFAEVFLWDCDSWKLMGKLAGHSLTVTRMQFSRDGLYLLTVSRDRTWIMYRKVEDPAQVYVKVDVLTGKNKVVSHSRIIWDCCFLQGTSFEYHFITVSRDKKAILWSPQDQIQDLEKNVVWNSGKRNVLTLDFPITAVASKDLNPKNGICYSATHLVALGLETGAIKCFTLHLHQSNENPRFILQFQVPQSHSLTVKRLAFRPTQEKDVEKDLNCSHILASCSEDHSVRLHKFQLNRECV